MTCTLCHVGLDVDTPLVTLPECPGPGWRLVRVDPEHPDESPSAVATRVTEWGVEYTAAREPNFVQYDSETDARRTSDGNDDAVLWSREFTTYRDRLTDWRRVDDPTEGDPMTGTDETLDQAVFGWTRSERDQMQRSVHAVVLEWLNADAAEQLGVDPDDLTHEQAKATKSLAMRMSANLMPSIGAHVRRIRDRAEGASRRGLEFRVETACDGYSSLAESDVPDVVSDSDDYILGAHDAAETIREALHGGRAATAEGVDRG